jgi:hypothetical protein
VVKHLTLDYAIALPQDFWDRYINACMGACDAIERKGSQNRPVRLVCVFLQSLIRAKVVNVEAVQFELRAFCVKHSRIREAASLFRLLQASQPEGGESLSPSPVPL